MFRRGTARSLMRRETATRVFLRCTGAPSAARHMAADPNARSNPTPSGTRQELSPTARPKSQPVGRRRGTIEELHIVHQAGDTPRPSGETLYAIAEALGVTMSDLLAVDSSPISIRRPRRRCLSSPMTNFRADVRTLASIRFRGDQPKTKSAGHISTQLSGSPSGWSYPGLRTSVCEERATT